ncbi:MAG TPA: hypothetical protein VF824_01900 [Thermoanaerobaculia bacterium]|jgi:hypothetical protein
MTETILKHVEATGVYLHRRVTDDSGALVSEERLKRDPVLVFSPPPAANIGATGLAAVSIRLQLVDFDGEPRSDSGTVTFRLRDRADANDGGVTFTRPLALGELTLALDFDIAGTFNITVEPPFLADMQLAEAIVIEVR